jgi:hypothetical protein
MNTWERLEQKIHDYFYNGETKLRLSHLVRVKQDYKEWVAEYVRRFRDTCNKWYSLTIGKRDLTELAFVGLSSSLRDKLEGKDFMDVNQMLENMLDQENNAKEHKAYIWFKEINS